jgi:hypothetical protein
MYALAYQYMRGRPRGRTCRYYDVLLIHVFLHLLFNEIRK